MAVDEAFAVGAETSLCSFLRENPWFEARVIVVSTGLGTQARASLTELYPVEFGGRSRTARGLHSTGVMRHNTAR